VKDEDFADLFWSRLVRGYTNCEGQNYALALLLRQSFSDVQLYETRWESSQPTATREHHMLVLVRSQDGWFFADAWSSASLFHVAGLDLGRPLSGIPEYHTLDRTGPLRHHGLFEASAYIQGRPERTPDIEACDIAAAEREAAACAHEALLDSRWDLWRDYLTVRLRHVEGRVTGLPAAYAELLIRHRPNGMTRQLIENQRERAKRLASIL
jgi:hypothetical protein